MDIDKKCRSSVFFYVGIALWLIALTAWIFYTVPLTLIAGCLASISFLFHCSQKKIINMFGKNKKVITAAPALKPESTQVSNVVSGDDIPPYTVIGSGICIEGDLVSSCHVEIYGEVKGDIQVENGLVRVMSGGKVNGNIICNDLYVDGEVTGECNAKTADVDEHGNISGKLTYSCLSVKHGAVLSGTLNFKERPVHNITPLTLTKDSTSISGQPDNKVAKETKSSSKQK